MLTSNSKQKVSNVSYRQHEHNNMNPQESLSSLLPFTLCSYVALSRINKAAASPFKGSDGFGYNRSWGRNASKTFTKSAKQVHYTLH